MSRARVAAGVSLLVVLVVGGGAVALAALPLTPKPHVARAASAQVGATAPGGARGEPSVPGGLSLVQREDVMVPSTPSAELREAVVVVDAVVADDGAVTAVRLASASFQSAAGLRMRIDGPQLAGGQLRGRQMEMESRPGRGTSAGAFDGAAVSASLEAMVAATTDAVGRWRFAAPAAAPAIARVVVHFDTASAVATVRDVRPLSGFAAVPSSTAEPAPVRVGANFAMPARTVHVAPVYPAVARAARVQGVVIMEVTVDVEGAPADVRVLRSIPLLDEAAIEAVRQWRYTPTLLNGVPVPVTVTVPIHFDLEP